MARAQRRPRSLSSGAIRFLALIALLIALLWASSSKALTPAQSCEDLGASVADCAGQRPDELRRHMASAARIQMGSVVGVLGGENL